VGAVVKLFDYMRACGCMDCCGCAADEEPVEDLESSESEGDDDDDEGGGLPQKAEA